MGAIEQGGYRFDMEYSVLLQRGALHVYRNGEFIEELSFDFQGQQPDPEQIGELVSSYVEAHQ
ncbi:DUF5370 family protein [Ectobacillus ponti]|uniref:YbxH family protein n=1 Tax=Ectobacillus ponti TaxID=2961894 RepID=A0AA41XBT9_9BACI|nr:DUF5370 family protein [Ectobacillus ponti]MCP8970788.1 YbxH family protein [Ectobacillus ponti]